MTRAILTDIEGTTSSISFVHEVLFPYAREHMSAFVTANETTPDVAQCLDDVRQLVGQALTTNDVIKQLLQWIAEDKKITPLKSLQGLIWESGYKKGDFKGHIYPDAVRWLKQWDDDGILLYVYSSGSVHAQKLLFGHTEQGDLTPLFSNYFDTHSGHKREAESYIRIAQEIGLEPQEILFLSDIVEELDAAFDAGMRTTLLVRDANNSNTHSKHPLAHSFDDVVL